MSSINDLFNKIGEGLNPDAAKEYQDHTTPRKIKWFGYPLLVFMAWRTWNILLATVPHDLVGYTLACFGLLTTEIGSLIWFEMATQHAHDEEGNRDQRAIAVAMTVGCFFFSMVTSIADVSDITGIASIVGATWAMPFAFIGSAVWTIFNAVMWMLYRNASPVSKAIRERKRNAFQLQLEKQKTDDSITYLSEKARLLEQELQVKEPLLERAESAQKRVDQLNARLESVKGNNIKKKPTPFEAPAPDHPVATETKPLGFK